MNHELAFHFLEKNLLRIFKIYKPKVVVHLAAQPGVRYSFINPQAYIDSNITKKKNNLKNNDLLQEFPYVDKNPLILKSYKIDLVEFSELIEPEPLP